MADNGAISGLPFQKMHGLGNDFVVIDARVTPVRLTAHFVRALADRHRGVGFDQLALVESDNEADLRLAFYNADGSQSATCGNATRCIARAEMTVTGRTRLTLRTERGILQAIDSGDGLTSVNMGHPGLGWAEIPLRGAVDTLHLPIKGARGDELGNPHCTFFVDDVEAIDLASLGPKYETHPLFPERTNVQFAQVVGLDHLRMRVWERGTGITLASGSSSCATAVAAARRGLTGRNVRLTLDGGDIWIDWRQDGVWMSGPTAHVFSGVLTGAFLEAVT